MKQNSVFLVLGSAILTIVAVLIIVLGPNFYTCYQVKNNVSACLAERVNVVFSKNKLQEIGAIINEQGDIKKPNNVLSAQNLKSKDSPEIKQSKKNPQIEEYIENLLGFEEDKLSNFSVRTQNSPSSDVINSLNTQSEMKKETKNYISSEDNLELQNTQPYLSIDKIFADNQNYFFLGKGENNLIVQLFVDEKMVAKSKVENGTWEITIDKSTLKSLTKKIRIDFFMAEETGILASARVNFSDKKTNSNVRNSADDRLNFNNKITVQEGDSLWSLAQYYYGAGYRYRVIYDANSDIIKNPSWIYPGQIFNLPN